MMLAGPSCTADHRPTSGPRASRIVAKSPYPAPAAALAAAAASTSITPPRLPPTPPQSPSLKRNATPPSPVALKRGPSFPDKMAAAAKSFFHGIGGHHHGPHLPRSSTSKGGKPANRDDDPEFQRLKEQEKHHIASWDANSSQPLDPTDVCRKPMDKQIGCSYKNLERKDFKLIKTIGTGTFARVWLAKLAKAQPGDEDKVFALKILQKVDVIKLKQVDHVRNERNVLASVAGHPFITTMVASFQDADNLYMILDYCPGGEVFTYLRNSKTFDEETTRFYAAEICLILEFLHEKEGVAYRDLKPENILIDADGHIKLVDFGFAKKLDGKTTWTLCGTPEYLAPETIRNTGHGPAVDWWAFGILIYEFLASRPPFWDNNPLKIYEQIVEGKLHFPAKNFSEEAKDLISKLCEVNPAKRLGNLRGGAQDVKDHPFFKGVDFDKVYRREQAGPIIPHLKSNDDTRNFEDYDGEPEHREIYTHDLRKKYDSMFEGF